MIVAQRSTGSLVDRRRRQRVSSLGTLFIVGLTVPLAVGQDKEPPRIERPARVFTIEGRVLMPEGMPSANVVVTLTSGSGIPRQVYTTEQGRFEFQGIPEGGYSLTAQSLTDPTLSAERVETDTSRTATGNLNVSLVLRKERVTAAPKKAKVVTVTEARQNVPKPARKAFNEALKFRREHQPEKALEKLTQALELYPDYYQAYAERGDLQVVQRQLAEAEVDFDRALKVNPRFGPALRGIGYCKLEKREFNEAAKYLEQAVSSQPDRANTYLLLGITYLELDHREQARAALMTALSFRTLHELRAHIYLGKLFARQRLYREAADEIRKYLEAKPLDPEAEFLKALESKWRSLGPDQ